MRGYKLSFLVILFACSNWSQITKPEYGISIDKNEIVLVRNTDLNSNYNHELTEKVLSAYTDCDSRFINFLDVLDQLHANLLELENYKYPNSEILARIRKATAADYYLTGGFYEDWGAEYYDLNELDKVYDPAELAPIKKYEFRLYDLRMGEQVFTTNLTWTKDYSVSEGLTRVYLPSVGVYSKLVKKLRSSCRCE